MECYHINQSYMHSSFFLSFFFVSQPILGMITDHIKPYNTQKHALHTSNNINLPTSVFCGYVIFK